MIYTSNPYSSSINQPILPRPIHPPAHASNASSPSVSRRHRETAVRVRPQSRLPRHQYTKSVMEARCPSAKLPIPSALSQFIDPCIDSTQSDPSVRPHRPGSSQQKTKSIGTPHSERTVSVFHPSSTETSSLNKEVAKTRTTPRKSNTRPSMSGPFLPFPSKP